LLFAAVNAARHAHVDPERAMEKTCDKFIRRFASMEQQAAQDGKTLSELSLNEQEALWVRAKEQEK